MQELMPDLGRLGKPKVAGRQFFHDNRATAAVGCEKPRASGQDCR